MFIWTEQLATGNKQIDDQHKEIFRKADEVFKLTATENIDQDSKEKLLKDFKFLISYMFEHFNAEENLMKQCNYEDFESHKAEHTQFIKKVGKLNKKLKETGYDIEFAEDLKYIIVELLVEHINETDKRFVDSVK
ncbi:bacteriohemerythrin [Desulfuribacillus alkaliarsenatis]|uniref:bacteriohemerythrin n=1 Tax=Desulfuribacillus alkaliarsenatis TaxID=766136 RepID=UPI00159F29D7|nr:bacteriohemerythrin [Desulfuribacillus alkaliarsenatis]